MTSRAALLAGLALAVMAAGVYLFIEVHASPADAQVPAPADPHAPVEATASDDTVTKPTTSDVAPQVGKPLGKPAGIGAIRGTGSVPVVQAADDHPAITDVPEKADPRFQMVLGEANKAYDRQDFDEARTIAQKVLAKDPNNARMLRIMVSSHCIEGDQAAAQTYYDKLPEFDRQQMTKRCSTYGVSFKEPGQ